MRKIYRKMKVAAAKKAARNQKVKSVSPSEGNTNDVLYMAMVAVIGEERAKKIKEQEKHKALTGKEVAQIKADTREKRAALLLLPPPPFETIIPAPGLGKKNPLDLCGYCSDKFPKVSAIPEFATCSPTVASVSSIYTALYPLANINPHKILPADKNTRDTLIKQLRQQFLLMMQSCAILANGNKALFLLTEVATKRAGTPHNETLPAPVFSFDYTKGRGKLGIKIVGVEFALGYTVWYGPGDFDRATWLSKNGKTRQIITGTPGASLNVFVVANGKKGPGDESNPQPANIPFN